MGDGDAGAACCCVFLALFAGWAIVSAILVAQQAAMHKEFLVKSTAMETLTAVLRQSSMVKGLLVPTSDVKLFQDIKENFKDVSCIPAAAPYKQCSFKTGMSGMGQAAGIKFPMGNGAQQAFAGNFTWGEITATVDVHKNCPNCNEMAINRLQVELHCKSLWDEWLINAGKSAGATLAANAGQFIVVEAINAIFGLEGKKRFNHELAIVVVNEYEFLRVTYVVTQDHDGDGDVSGEDAIGWNRIAMEIPQYVRGNEVMGVFSTSGDLSLGHYVAGHVGAAAGVIAVENALDAMRGAGQPAEGNKINAPEL